MHPTPVPSAAQLHADHSTLDATVIVVSYIYRVTASRAETSLTWQEAGIVSRSLDELEQGKYQTFDNADELIRHLKSDNY